LQRLFLEKEMTMKVGPFQDLGLKKALIDAHINTHTHTHRQQAGDLTCILSIFGK